MGQAQSSIVSGTGGEPTLKLSVIDNPRCSTQLPDDGQDLLVVKTGYATTIFGQNGDKARRCVSDIATSRIIPSS
jgi:hypothetical protein